MKRGIFLFVFFLAILLFVSGCNRSSSQTAYQEPKIECYKLERSADQSDQQTCSPVFSKERELKTGEKCYDKIEDCKSLLEQVCELKPGIKCEKLKAYNEITSERKGNVLISVQNGLGKIDLRLKMGTGLCEGITQESMMNEGEIRDFWFICPDNNLKNEKIFASDIEVSTTLFDAYGKNLGENKRVGKLKATIL